MHRNRSRSRREREDSSYRRRSRSASRSRREREDFKEKDDPTASFRRCHPLSTGRRSRSREDLLVGLTDMDGRTMKMVSSSIDKSNVPELPKSLVTVYERSTAKKAPFIDFKPTVLPTKTRSASRDLDVRPESPWSLKKLDDDEFNDFCSDDSDADIAKKKNTLPLPDSYTKFKIKLLGGDTEDQNSSTVDGNVSEQLAESDIVVVSDEEEHSQKKTPNKRPSKLSLSYRSEEKPNRSEEKPSKKRKLLKPDLEKLVKEQETMIKDLKERLSEAETAAKNKLMPIAEENDLGSPSPFVPKTSLRFDILKQELVYKIDSSGIEMDPALQSNILQSLEMSSQKAGWADLHGLDQLKQVLKEAVLWPLQAPHLFKGVRRPPKGIMLFGPPGTGKTMIAKLIASDCGRPYFFSISASTITSQYTGIAEKSVKVLFDIARIAGNAVIFLDEMESLLKNRGSEGNNSSGKMKTEFLIHLSRMMEDETCNTLFIGATNKPFMIDEAVRRRLEKRLYVPLPDQPARAAMLKGMMAGIPNTLSDEDIQKVASATNHFSGADMLTLTKDATNAPVRKVVQEGRDLRTIQEKDLPPATLDDFMAALTTIKPSVNLKDIQEYVKFNKQFGCSV